MSERRTLPGRQAMSLGRSGPRSKTGCRTCKLRRVRCNEKRPVCGDCERLQLDCVYLPPQKRRPRRTHTEADHEATYTSQAHLNHAQSDEAEPLGIARATATSGGMYQTLDHPSAPSDAVQPPTYEPQAATPQDDSEFLLQANIDSNMGEAGSAIDAYAQDSGGNADWQVGLLGNDYLALPDPTFPFTSMAFIGSSDLPAPQSGAGIVDFGALGSDGLRGPVDTGMETIQRETHFGTTPDGQYSFTVSPPLLSPSQEETLLTYFERQIRPPASLVGVDPVGWAKIWRCAVKMARERHESVLHAVFALSTLLTASKASIRLGMNRNDHVLFASRLQEAACAAIQLGASHPEWEKKNSQALLVSVFLLAWFEVSLQFRSGILTDAVSRRHMTKTARYAQLSRQNWPRRLS